MKTFIDFAHTRNYFTIPVGLNSSEGEIYFGVIDYFNQEYFENLECDKVELFKTFAFPSIPTEEIVEVLEKVKVLFETQGVTLYWTPHGSQQDEWMLGIVEKHSRQIQVRHSIAA